MTVDQALAWAQAHGVARHAAQALLTHRLQCSRSWLITHGDAPLPADLPAQLQQLADGLPLAYLLGEQGFHGLNLQVNPATLIPRPDTETLVDWALDLMPPTAPVRVLDLGTGSGAIALALQHQRPQAEVHAVDASADALATARANGERLRLPVHWHAGDWADWFAPVRGQRFDLIASNPPYIAEGDSHLPALRHEPLSALTAGPDGLADLRRIVADAPAHLAPGGWLLLEHGFDQADAVAALLHARGFGPAAHRVDVGGHRRCTGAPWSAGSAAVAT